MASTLDLHFSALSRAETCPDNEKDRIMQMYMCIYCYVTDSFKKSFRPEKCTKSFTDIGQNTVVLKPAAVTYRAFLAVGQACAF